MSALTVLATTDPSVTLDGSVGSVTNPPSGSNKGIDWTGLIPGVNFDIALIVSGTRASINIEALEVSAQRLVIFVDLASSAGTGTSTASQVIAAVNADPVAGKLVQGAPHPGNNGSGVITTNSGNFDTDGQGTPAVAPSNTTLPMVVAAGAAGSGQGMNAGPFTWTNTGEELLVIANDDAGDHTEVVYVTSTDTLTTKSFPIIGNGGSGVTFVAIGPFPVATWGATPSVAAADPTGMLDVAVVSASAVYALGYAAGSAVPDDPSSPAGSVTLALEPAEPGLVYVPVKGYTQGQGVRVVGTFLDVTGAPLDPSSVVFKYQPGSAGSPVTDTYDNADPDCPVKRDGTGVYHVDLDTTAGAGTWTVRFVGTGADVTAGQLTFTVAASLL